MRMSRKSSSLSKMKPQMIGRTTDPSLIFPNPRLWNRYFQTLALSVRPSTRLKCYRYFCDDSKGIHFVLSQLINEVAKHFHYCPSSFRLTWESMVGQEVDLTDGGHGEKTSSEMGFYHGRKNTISVKDKDGLQPRRMVRLLLFCRVMVTND